MHRHDTKQPPNKKCRNTSGFTVPTTFMFKCIYCEGHAGMIEVPVEAVHVSLPQQMKPVHPLFSLPPSLCVSYVCFACSVFSWLFLKLELQSFTHKRDLWPHNSYGNQLWELSSQVPNSLCQVLRLNMMDCGVLGGNPEMGAVYYPRNPVLRQEWLTYIGFI